MLLLVSFLLGFGHQLVPPPQELSSFMFLFSPLFTGSSSHIYKFVQVSLTLKIKALSPSLLFQDSRQIHHLSLMHLHVLLCFSTLCRLASKPLPVVTCI